jgi:ribosome-associated protein
MTKAKTKPKSHPERERAEQIVAAALGTKAADILVYDMEQRSAITDYVVICSGRSQAHVRGIAEKIDAALSAQGVRYSSIEGFQEGSWVLLDYDLVIVHIFHPETRGFYDLESLLASYPCERVASPAPDADDSTPAA